MTPLIARITLTRLAGIAAHKSGFCDAHEKVAADWRDILSSPEAAELSESDRKYFAFLARNHEAKAGTQS